MCKDEWNKAEEATLVAVASRRAKLYARVDRAVCELNSALRKAKEEGVTVDLRDLGHESFPRVRVSGTQICEASWEARKRVSTGSTAGHD